MSVNGTLSEHQKSFLKILMYHYDSMKEHLVEIETHLQEDMLPFALQIEQLNTIYRAGDQGKEHSSIRSCTARYRSTASWNFRGLRPVILWIRFNLYWSVFLWRYTLSQVLPSDISSEKYTFIMSRSCAERPLIVFRRKWFRFNRIYNLFCKRMVKKSVKR